MTIHARRSGIALSNSPTDRSRFKRLGGFAPHPGECGRSREGGQCQTQYGSEREDSHGAPFELDVAGQPSASAARKPRASCSHPSANRRTNQRSQNNSRTARRRGIAIGGRRWHLSRRIGHCPPRIQSHPAKPAGKRELWPAVTVVPVERNFRKSGETTILRPIMEDDEPCCARSQGAESLRDSNFPVRE